MAFCWLGLLEDIPKQVARLRTMVQDGMVKGVKFQPLVQHFFPEEKRLFPIYEACQELAIPVSSTAVLYPILLLQVAATG